HPHSAPRRFIPGLLARTENEGLFLPTPLHPRAQPFPSQQVLPNLSICVLCGSILLRLNRRGAETQREERGFEPRKARKGRERKRQSRNKRKMLRKARKGISVVGWRCGRLILDRLL